MLLTMWICQVLGHRDKMTRTKATKNNTKTRRTPMRIDNVDTRYHSN